MVTASEPGWLHIAGQAAGTILLIELGIALFIILILMLVLAISAWWIKSKLSPVLREYGPKATQAMSTTRQGTDRVVQSVAEFYGRRQQIETGLRVLLFGRDAARRVHENALARANIDLELMLPAEDGPGPENGWTPHPHPNGREVYSAADRPATPPAIEPPEAHRAALPDSPQQDADDERGSSGDAIGRGG